MLIQRYAGFLLASVAAIAVFVSHARSGDDAPPPVPYGTQQTIKLKALVDAAPFMAKGGDELRGLLQERLRVCVEIFENAAERVDLGRANTDSISGPIADVKDAWAALCTSDDQRMPILKYVLQLAEHREESIEALHSTGQSSSTELLSAKRDRLSAEIELAHCQRSGNRQDASAR